MVKIGLRGISGKVCAIPTGILSVLFLCHGLNNTFPFGFLRTKKRTKALYAQYTR